MMTPFRAFAAALTLFVPALPPTPAQTVNSSQQVTLQGLRSSNNHGSFTAARFAPDGSLFLLLDEHDGVRLLKTDPTASIILAQTLTGAAGDSGLALALDPAGNVYVAGTSTSGTLAGTSGAAFPTRADTSTNSFLARYDANLNPVFLTFLGSGRTSVAALAVNAGGAYVTGITFNPTFPVTPSAIQQAPASGASENGFVQHFSPDGATLLYSTYLTGANGATVPTAIAADASGNAYIAGSTSSPGLPTLAALVPEILGATSGFLTKLTPAADGITFSTFLPGNGITSLALDAQGANLLLTGNIAPGQFPIATVATPLASAAYQTFLRLPVNGQSVASSVLLVPGAQSFVTPAPDGSVWISGALTTPLFPGTTPPDYPSGDSFLLHLTAQDNFDQTLRFGGLPIDNPGYASLTTTVAAPAVGAAAVLLPGSLTASASSSLLATQRFDLPTVQTPNAVLPNTLRDVLPTPASCTNSSLCSGSGAFLAAVSPTFAASLALSADDLPNLTLRNLGSAPATGLALNATGYTLSSDCGTTLDPSNACGLALTGAGPGSLTVSATNAPSYTLTLPANNLAPDPLALSTNELDFGIATSPATTRTLTVTNLSTTPQIFISARDAIATTAPQFSQSSTDCPAATAPGSYTLTPSATCHLTFAFAASSSSVNDGPTSVSWKVGARDVKLTASAQAASVNLSATELDFGTQFTNTPALNLPRYLYLSNNATIPVAHTPATLPAGSPFTLTDNCPTTLEPRTVCRLTLTYLSPAAPSADSLTLVLDNGATVLLTGQTLPPASVTGSVANPSLSVNPTALTFAAPVTVSSTSGTAQAVTVKNTGTQPFALALAITGDFTFTSGCPTTLAAGASCQLLVDFAPSLPGARQGILSLTAGSGFAPTYVTLAGTASAILPANNGTLDLGQTLAGEPVLAFYKIQQTLPTLTITSNSPQFGLVLVQDTGTAPTTLPAASFQQIVSGACTSCYLGIQFLSQTPGPQSATLTFTTTPNGSPYRVTAAASALPVEGLLLTPITTDFGPVSLNSTSAPIIFTLANLLPEATGATITSVTATGDFALAPNTTGGPACTGTLAATASCFLQVQFTPTAIGPRTGILTLVTTEGTATATLSGYGQPGYGIAFTPAALTFFAAPGAASTQQTITLTNTGSGALTIGTPLVSSPAFTAASTCATLSPAASCNLTVQYTPGAATASGTLTLPVTLTLNGQAVATTYTVPLTGAFTSEDAGLQILPGEVNFGSTATGALGYTREFTLNNLTARPLSVTLSLPRQFPLADAGACGTLSANASCTFSVSFLPITNGALTGSVFASGTPADGSAPVQALAYMLGYGAGSGTLSITGGNLIPNTPLSFGQIASGQTATQTLTLTNTGVSPLTVRRITSDPPFLATTTCAATLAPNAACTVTLTYAPLDELPTGSANLSARTDAGSLILESDAASSPDILDLTGLATPILSSSPASSAQLATYTLSQSALTFPNTTIGNQSSAQTVTLTNTGNIALNVSSVIAPTDFTTQSTCSTLLPGAACTLTITFAPTTASISSIRSGAIEILSSSGASLEFLTVLGISSAAPLTLSPITLDFGTVNLGGSSSPLPVAVTNTTAAPITFLGTSTTGDYAVARGTCPANASTLAANASCTLQVIFTPTTTGTRTGLLNLSTDATTLPLTIALTGIGASAHLQASPTALAFGPIAVGAPANLTLSLRNTGSAAVNGLAATITGPNAADFAVTVPCSTTTLAPSAGCSVTVTFTPSATGARSATLTLASSDPASPLVIPLTGTGSQPGSFTLTVNGATAASATVASGSPAVFPVTLTPLSGFTGAVALTCAPLAPALYASCSVLSPTLTLYGSAQNSTVTINTITTAARPGSPGKTLALALLFPALAFLAARRRRCRQALTLPLLTVAAIACLALGGCGGKSTPVDPNLRTTPAGTYQYAVTATSTSGPQVSSTVTLTVTVQ